LRWPCATAAASSLRRWSASPSAHSLQPAPGQDPRRAGGLRGGGREARVPPADLRRTLQRGLCRRNARADGQRAPMAMTGARKIIARRAALELRPQPVVNLGIGMPEGVAAVAAEERVIDLITLTAEPGVIGGIPAGGLNFGAAGQHPGRDRPALPVRLLRRRRPGHRLPGPGPGRPPRQRQRQQVRPAPGRRGRLHQHQPERQAVVFVGLRRQLELAVADGALRITREGGARKFVRSGRAPHLQRPPRRWRRGQPVLYVTERAVFACCGPDADGEGGALELLEIAPGLDLQRDVLAHMGFRPGSARSRWACASSCWTARCPSAWCWTPNAPCSTSTLPGCR
jgi:hypothetical protein